MASKRSKSEYLTRRALTIAISLLSASALFATPALAYQSEAGKATSQATVKSESLSVYSRMSASSDVTRTLKKGDTVIVDFEIVTAEGAWCSVMEADQVTFLGYVRAESLERELSEEQMNWAYKPPVEPPASALDQQVVKKPRQIISISEVRNKLKMFFASKFGQSLPVSAYGQTSLHRRMGFNHNNGIDIAVHPDSLEGRALITYLHGAGIPFIAFRKAVAGAATGPHIHVGHPSPRR